MSKQQDQLIDLTAAFNTYKKKIPPELLQKISIPLSFKFNAKYEGLRYPDIPKFTSGQVNSASTGDTVLLTGIENKILEVVGLTVYDTDEGASDPTFRIEVDTGTS